jgi:hypothetical protein
MPNEIESEQQFDFWLGDWDVTWGNNERGVNRIRKILDGRVIQENFDGNPAISFRGMSLSVYSQRLEKWLQTWVDSEGNYWHFTGQFDDGRMTLVTKDVVKGKPISLRMIFYNISANELDWNWESSADGGQTWELKWHIHYTRQQGTADKN